MRNLWAAHSSGLGIFGNGDFKPTIARGHGDVRSLCSIALVGAILNLASMTNSVAQVERVTSAVLSMEKARERGARVSNVAYEFTVRLDGESLEYTGGVRVNFDLAGVRGESDLTLDFAGGTVVSVVVNEAEVDRSYNGYYLTLPAESLTEGSNEVEIQFSHPYSSDGNGLYRFVDPEDNRVYLFSDFEPYHQNRLFPSFDQPDLKARYSARVTAPSNWVVVSVTTESSVIDSGDEKIWVFPASLPISTYVYALHAGEYHSWESRAGDIPLRLFARESLAQYVDPEDWFGFTRQGFEFFENYFDVPFPFGKYDQLIVPHFNAGAMENVGAVTFNERYVHRGVVTRQDRRALASVLLHEMAHMWFGNLVTMDWWSGLWLNESFATFMATVAMSEATEFSEAWQTAYTRTIRAYRADEVETTHSIDLPVADTDSAFANFDAITYEKGSAALKQLNYLVGPEVFRSGVSNYLKTHAYGNTTIGDFLSAISVVSDLNLDEWSREWLLEPGTNGVAVDLYCSDGTLSGLSLIQSAPAEWPTYRTHRTQLGLYRFGGGEVAIQTLPVTYSGETTKVVIDGEETCPDFVYPNHGDWDFARVRLDPDMLEVLGQQLENFADPLVRAMLWQGVWEMVLEARLKPTEYIDFVLMNLAQELDDSVVRQVLGTLEDSLSYLVRLDSAFAHLAELGPSIESFLWEQILEGPPGSDRRVFMFDRYVEIVSSLDGAERLAAVLREEEGVLPNGMELDQDRRWNVVHALSRLGHPAVAGFLVAERARDVTDQGRLSAMRAEVSRPDFETKAIWVEVLLSQNLELNLADVRAVTAALFPDNQHGLHRVFSEEIFSGLKTINGSLDASYFRPILRGLVKPLCTHQYLSQLNDAIDASGNLHPTLRRGLLETRFATTRCIAIGEYLASDK